MTEKLFYTDSHLQEFTAEVVSCRPCDNGYEAVLSRTAFFPEGGGQAADTGVIDGIRVYDVQEKGEQIFHYLEGELEEGKTVTGQIDWDKRFSRMQQHSGEHIVSGIVHARFGYDNVGFHLNDELCTLDLSGPLTKEELREVENAANEAVFANVPVQISYPSKEKLKTLDYRSKIEIDGQVRIVTIPGYDVCACCAPHVNFTGEIGLVKLVQSQNYKGGIRITMLCGRRALKDYQQKEESVKAIMGSLSAKEELIAEAVERVKEECTQLKSELAESRYQILEAQAEKIQEGQKKVCIFDSKLSGNEPRELMNLVLKKGTEVCAVFAGNDPLIHPSSTILLFYIMIASAIRAASGISCCRLIGSTAVRTLHGGHAKLGRIHGLIVHQFLLSRQNLIPDGIRIPAVFSLIFVDIHGHTDGIGRSALFKRGGNHCLPLDLILVKIMHDHIHRESAVYHIRRILHVTVDLGGISDSVFYDE